MEVAPGTIIDDKYRVIRQLGEGGMGTVFEVEHTLLDRRVALKVMNPDQVENERAVERFFREAKAASAIGHPNIIEIYDIGKEADGTLFFVMELLQGESLESLLDRQDRLSTERAAAIILQTLSALHFAHEKGIIHRDLKPANIFLAVDIQGREVVKLLDFGVAKVKDPSGKQKKLTLPGAMMGTPRYAAPEQIKGKGNIDHRIDLWAAGVVLYELIAGKRPFEGESFSVVLSNILMETPTPLRETLPDVSSQLSRIAEKAMAKNPDERYQTAMEMIRDLTPFQGAALSVMSGEAAEVLSTSFPPAAPYDLITPGYAPSGPKPAPSIPLAKEHPVSAPMMSGSLPSERSGGFLKSAIGRVVLVSSILVLVGVSMMFGLGIFSAGVRAQINGEEYRLKALTVTPSLKPATEVTSKAPSEVKPTDDAADEKTGEKPEEGSAESSEVTITLAGLPKGAAVTLDGKPTQVPIQVARSEQPAVLTITARGYEPHIQAVSLSESQDVEIAMEKKTSRKKSRKRRASKKK